MSLSNRDEMLDIFCAIKSLNKLLKEREKNHKLKLFEGMGESNTKISFGMKLKINLKRKAQTHLVIREARLPFTPVLNNSDRFN